MRTTNRRLRVAPRTTFVHGLQQDLLTATFLSLHDSCTPQRSQTQVWSEQGRPEDQGNGRLSGDFRELSTWASTSLICWGSQVHTWVCFNPGKWSLNILPCFLCSSSISLCRRVSLRGLMNLNRSQTVAVGISSNGLRPIWGALLARVLTKTQLLDLVAIVNVLHNILPQLSITLDTSEAGLRSAGSVCTQTLKTGQTLALKRRFAKALSILILVW